MSIQVLKVSSPYHLPPNMVAELSLPYIAKIQANLADNSKVATNAYAIRILWNGVERDVVVLAMSPSQLNVLFRASKAIARSTMFLLLEKNTYQ
ncbi:hypothetical protein F7734_09675 [Scytonema sp. UIC 10036]|uniref:hypothetical protein n=1 Tax=Scytonema sp. UIC 10036 TaxID=2304196 RepID=UPI0012DAC134|nr:hypothetical protein [Scytonema sp. UIC 10036]MUG92706.1 hypothetical protein [Scytonema sp. UIC 10036]